MSDVNSPRLRFDPSFSWGDLGALIAAVAFAGTLHARLDERVNGTVKEIERVDTVAHDAIREVRAVQATDDARREQLRQEIKKDLVEINDKLDRLIERGLNVKTR